MPLRDIETIIFLMMENRSFDHALGYLSTGPHPMAVEGLRDEPAWVAAHANSWRGQSYTIHKLPPALQQIADPPHDHAAIAEQLGGTPPTMQGFVSSYATRSPHPPPDPSVVMGHYTADAVPMFDFFARTFAVCDHWFAALPTGTQPNRLMAMAGMSKLLDNARIFLPDEYLVYDWLTAKAVPWCAYQSGDFFPFFALNERWLPEMVTSLALSSLGGRGRFRRYTRFREHWLGPAPMPSVIFIEPEYTDGPHSAPNDDHPPTGVGKGQALLADLHATLTANPVRWRNTVLIVTYDEHGGFFDHVPPLPIPAIAGGESLATTGLRVPAFVVSPHVAPGVPFTDTLDHTSFLQLLADRFTPGQPYSAEVAARQAHLGRLATVLTELPGPQPGGGLDAATRARALALGAKSPASSGTTDSPSAARTTAAFEAVAQKVASEHPDLLAASGWHGLAAHLRRAPGTAEAPVRTPDPA